MKTRTFLLMTVAIPLALGLGLAACSGDDDELAPRPISSDSGNADQTVGGDASLQDTSPPPLPEGGGTDAREGGPKPEHTCGFPADSGATFECDDPTMCASG
jgi:hypothetical protein